MSDYLSNVFTLNNNDKSNLFNLIQYTVLAIIPIVLVNKTMQKYVPPVDDTKSSIEILIEVIIQLLFIIVSLFFIDRIITHIQTYSEEPYQPVLNHTWSAILFVMIILTLQSKLGEKINILFDRAYHMIFNSEDNDDDNSKKNIMAIQPIQPMPISVQRPNQGPQTTAPVPPAQPMQMPFLIPADNTDSNFTSLNY